MPQFAAIQLEPEEAEKLDQIIKAYLRLSRPKFLKALALQFSQQYHSGDIPDWPPKFVTRADISAKEKAGPPKKGRPGKKPKKPKPRQRPPDQSPE